MDVGQDLSGNDNGVIAEQVEESLGEPQDAVAGINESQEEASGNQGSSRDSLSVQKRLKAQRRSHDRDMHEMQSRIDYLQSQLQSNQPGMNGMQSGQMGEGSGDQVQDAIHKAVSFALQQKDMEERRAKESEAQRHIANQYVELNRHLDSVSDKYDDFDDVVRGDIPFTAHMRDAALMLPKKGPGSAGEVLYQLGRNPENLSRIAKLHPVDQAAELVALSHALTAGGDKTQSTPTRPLGQIKSNPVVNSAGVTEKTPVSDIRNRMKKGTFK